MSRLIGEVRTESEVYRVCASERDVSISTYTIDDGGFLDLIHSVYMNKGEIPKVIELLKKAGEIE